MESIAAHHRFLTATLAVLLCAGCASKPKQAASQTTAAPATALAAATDENPDEGLQPPTAAEAAVAEAAEESKTPAQTVEFEAEIAAAEKQSEDEPEDPCDQQDAAGWLDSSQEWIYETTCRTAAWFDGFFGKQRYDERSGNTYGRLGIGGFWDQRDGFDPSLRFRATFALPALRERATSLSIGRGDEEEIVEERTTKFDTIPGNFDKIGDDSFLVGLGVNSKRRTGFKLSVGAKIRAPPQPYIKLRYRKHIALTESTLLGIRPIIYLDTEDELGSTLHIEIDQLLSENLLLRWANYGNVATGEEVEGLEWQTSLILFQAFSNRRAVTYRTLVYGETDAEVPLQNFGFEVRYRQRILRKWLFFEVFGGVTWPQFLLTEEREANPGIGAGIEMYFGPVPDTQMY